MLLLPVFLVVLSGLFPFAHAWGSLGHRTVAYLSTLYSTHPTSPRFLTYFLNGQDVSEAALFPDKVAHIPSFAYSRPWHYIDARDSPPHECAINMTRDCLSDGCVVSAIANHTSRVTSHSLPKWQRSQSLRFVLHFVGDIHQPLHTENVDRGGNEISVLFDGKHTNLHSVWDSLTPNKYRHREEWFNHTAESEEEAAYLWALELFKSDPDPDSCKDECVSDATDCALEWAEESNALVCSYVLKDDVVGLQGRDLGGVYYEGATGIIDEQIRKGGRRLGMWVDLMAKAWDKERDGYELEVQEL